VGKGGGDVVLLKDIMVFISVAEPEPKEPHHLVGDSFNMCINFRSF
jgi:hypothetical protein